MKGIALVVFFLVHAGCDSRTCGCRDVQEEDAGGEESAGRDFVPEIEEAEGDDGDAGQDMPPGDPGIDEVVSEDATVEDETEEGLLGPRFPIIFIHGQAGHLDDWMATLRWLVENDDRWAGFHEAGTESFNEWEAGSIDPAYWLFNFTYYNRFPSDPGGEYTAGPGMIGSNGEFLCLQYDRPGHLPATADAYYEGIDHEYAGDLRDVVDAVLEATGADKVDIVAHSMGGLIARSYIQFHEGYEKVRRLMLISSPIHGIPFTDLIALYPFVPRWMLDHEFTELDDAIEPWDIGFFNCEVEDGPVMAWHEGLNQTDGPASDYVTYYVIVGENDELFSLEDVEYTYAEWHLVVPGTNHNSVRSHPETCRRIMDYLGG